MTVASLMTSDPAVCGPRDSLREAARVLFDRDCGIVPVVDPGGALLGVVTDRDLCRAAWRSGRRLEELRVEEWMSTRLTTCGPGDSLGKAESRMRAARVRRLPVVEANGRLLGILSLADLARHLGSGGGTADSAVSETGVAETLGRICAAPASPDP